MKKKTTTKKETLSEEAYALVHPTRYKIVKLLRSKEKLYIAQIAKKLELNPKVASFHLTVLANYGFVDGDYGLKNPKKGAPKAVKYYRLTNKVDQVLSKLRKELE